MLFRSLLKYVMLHPFQISRRHLAPQPSNPLVASLVPPQTYLQFGSEAPLDVDRGDIDCQAAVLVVEHDQEYMRIDEFKSLD